MHEGAPNNYNPNEKKRFPYDKAIATLLVVLVAYFATKPKDVDGIPIKEYKRVEKRYKKLKKQYNDYKKHDRKLGYITPEGIDELREIFILMHAHAAQEIHEKEGIPASIVLAQAIIESDAGTSGLTSLTNNYFGIKCMQHSQGECLNNEYSDCVQYVDDHDYDHFKKYKDAKECFADYVRVLKENKDQRYDVCFACGDNYVCWATELKKAGYATNIKYAQMIVEIIEDYGLEFLDKKDVYYITLEDVKSHMPKK